ncbi:Hint domain-containing protein [Pendulispora brunnea]|uniref:Hint domain-containing protein n=1 Tax=Pendulispora brunnea TaxID=2905690 RepID=A0ABZ2K613_9BACT
MDAFRHALRRRHISKLKYLFLVIGMLVLVAVGQVRSAPRACDLGEDHCHTEGQCFVAGTLVATPSGERPIESLAVGDLVLARGESDDVVAPRHITRTFVRAAPSLVDVIWMTIDGERERVRSTPEHPYFTLDRGWIAAEELRVNEALLDRDGHEVHVAKVLPIPQEAMVYNLEVDVDHTFFVGRTGIWVHNQCMRDDFGVPGGPGGKPGKWGKGGKGGKGGKAGPGGGAPPGNSKGDPGNSKKPPPDSTNDKNPGNSKGDPGNSRGDPGNSKGDPGNSKKPPPDPCAKSGGKPDSPASTGGKITADPDGAVFWSGRDSKGTDVKESAEAWARANGRNTLEGRIKDQGICSAKWNPKDPTTKDWWRTESRIYAGKASGNAYFFAGSDRRDNSTWDRIEFPQLKANPKVNCVYQVDADTLQQKLIYTKPGASCK